MRLSRLLAPALAGMLLAGGALAQTAAPSEQAAPPAAAQPATSAAKHATKAAAAADMAPVNVNAAGEEELMKLPRIGRKRAAAIVAHRPYSAPEDLVAKKAVSQAVFERIKAKVVVH